MCQTLEKSTTTVDKSQRNRHETRVTAVFNALPAVAGTKWEGHVAAIARVERLVFKYQPLDGMWKPSRETAYYASNKPVAVQTAAEAIVGTGISKTKRHRA
jgi:hypothetical protein